MKVSKIIAAALSLAFLSGIPASSFDYNKEYQITANAENTVSQVDYTLGDVNKDGHINAVDASSVLSYYALVSTNKDGEFDEKQRIAADVNKDESINAVDASCILAYYAYISTTKDDIKSLADFLASDKKESTPVLRYFTSDIQDIYINEEKTVKFTVEASEKLSNDAISLYDGSDNFVSYMFDDGTNGDEKANDGIYSKDIVLSSEAPQNVKYYASTDNEKTKTRQICFYRDLTQDDIDGVLALNEKLKSLSFEEACEYIKNSNEVSHYSINEEISSISYKTIYGFGCVWEPQDDNTNNENDGRGVLAIHEKDVRNNSLSENLEIAMDKIDYVSQINLTPYNNHNIIVLDQTNRENDDRAEMVGRIMNKAFNRAMSIYDASRCEVKYDSDVTIDCMKNLSDYDTVIMHCHGQYYTDSDNVDHPYICTGQIRSSINPYSIVEDIMYGDIWGDRCILCNNSRYDVTDEFFDKYYENGSLNNSIWYLGSCYSMFNERIANTLIAKGAETVLGFTDTVNSIYNEEMLFETFINGMILSSDTVGKSADEAYRINGEKDPYNKDTQLKVVGNMNYRFVNYIMDPIHSSESLPYVNLIFNFSGDDMGVDVHDFESDPRFLYLTNSFSYAFGPTADTLSTYKYIYSYNNSSDSDGNGLLGVIFPQANDGTYYIVDVIKDDYAVEESGYNLVLDSCNSQSNHYYKKIVYSAIDLRPSRQPQYRQPDNSDNFLKDLCNKTGGRYLTYSEDNVDYLVDFIDFRLNQY